MSDSDKSNHSNSQRPFIHHFIWSWWKERIKPWLNFRAYFRQRKEILNTPTLNLLQKRFDNKNWRPPLFFATQGLIAPTLLLTLIIGILFGLVFKEPVDTWNIVQVKQLQRLTIGESFGLWQKNPRNFWEKVKADKAQSLRDLEHHIEKVKRSETQTKYYVHGTDFRIELSKEQYLAELESRLDFLKKELRFVQLAPKAESVKDKLHNFLVPATAILASYLFSLLFGIGSATREVHKRDIQTVYLYYVTASLFWPILFDAAITSIVGNMLIYRPSVFSVSLQTGGRDMLFNMPVLFVFVVRTIVILYFIIVIIHISRKMRSSLGLERIGGFRIYRGAKKIAIDLGISSFVAYLVYSFLSVGLALGYAYLIELRNQFGF